MADTPQPFRPRLRLPEVRSSQDDSLRPAELPRPGAPERARAETADPLFADPDLAALVTRLQDELAKSGDQDDDRRTAFIRRRFDEVNAQRVASGKTAFAGNTADALVERLLGYGFLEKHFKDPSVTEIMVNGSAGIFVERAGELVPTGERPRIEEVERIAARLLARIGRHMVSDAKPYQDGSLPDATRINVIHGSVTREGQGTTITIRRHRAQPFDMTTLAKIGAFTREAGEFMVNAIIGRASILVAGGTGSGKTTLVSALVNAIPSHERLVIIEDAPEINPADIPNWVGLVAQPPTPEAPSRFTMADAVRSALRMRPSRIIVGECRGAEAKDMLWAMTTGHEGSLTTLHSNSAQDALARLEMYIYEGVGENFPQRVVRQQIATGIDLVVYIARMPDRSRKVVEIAELTRYDAENQIFVLETLFQYDRAAQELRPTGRGLSRGLQERLRANGVNVDHLRSLMQVREGGR